MKFHFSNHKLQDFFKKGFTLMEMIVVLGSFAVLAVISTSVLFIALNNMAKARVTREVRRNGDSALQTMERQLRVAQALSSTQCGGVGGVPGPTLVFTDQYGKPAGFSCDSTTPNKFFIASGSGTPIALTDSAKVSVTPSCAIFTCDTAIPPQWVKISFSLKSNVNIGSSRPTEHQVSNWSSQINIRYQ